MKRILVALILIGNCAFAQLKNGEQVPDIEFKILLNSPRKSAKLSDLKGKLILIDFWATWCAPCVAAMPHLQALQTKFKGKLQIISVSDESVNRIGLFLKAKPSNLWFAVNQEENLNALFPHRTIPHVVLIDANGKLIANTSSDEITEELIRKLIHKEEVAIKVKSDNMSADFIKDYFYAADTVKQRLTIQPEIKGGPSMSKSFDNDPNFAGRRLTMINFSLESMYLLAYGELAYGRIINQTKKASQTKQDLFCLDIITKTSEELLPTLRAELLKRFELQARITQLLKPVYVLKVEDQTKVNRIPVNTGEGKGTYGAGSGTFSGDGVQFSDIAYYLEAFGILKLPVVDETGVLTKFNIQMVYQPENPNSLTRALSDLGLRLEKTERNIDMLTLSKDSE